MRLVLSIFIFIGFLGYSMAQVTKDCYQKT